MSKEDLSPKAQAFDKILDAMVELRNAVDKNMQKGRAKSLVETKLDEALMWAQAEFGVDAVYEVMVAAAKES